MLESKNMGPGDTVRLDVRVKSAVVPVMVRCETDADGDVFIRLDGDFSTIEPNIFYPQPRLVP